MRCMAIRIRRACEDDAALIVHYIRALAQYEKEAVENVRITEADVRRDGFGERRRFEVLIAESDGAAAGFALFFPTYSTWEGRPGMYVEDIFVEEAARKSGAGRALKCGPHPHPNRPRSFASAQRRARLAPSHRTSGAWAASASIAAPLTRKICHGSAC